MYVCIYNFLWIILIPSLWSELLEVRLQSLAKISWFLRHCEIIKNNFIKLRSCSVWILWLAICLVSFRALSQRALGKSGIKLTFYWVKLLRQCLCHDWTRQLSVSNKGRFTRYDLSARSVGPTVSERKSYVYFDTRFTADSWKRKSARFRKSVAVQQIFV